MIRVYGADVRPLLDEKLFAEKIRLVSSERKEKILRYRNKQDRCRSLAAGLLVREGVEEAGVSYEQAVVVAGEHGKPMLHTRQEGKSGGGQMCFLEGGRKELLHFNLSHAGDYAVAVFATQPAGIDIEGKYRIRNVDTLARRILTDRENVYWQRFRAGLIGDGEEIQRELASELARIWTRKEAYAKAVGDGLSLEFSQIETVEPETEDVFFLTEPFAEDMWLSICLVGQNEAHRQPFGDCTVDWKMMG